jgi:transposase-like protein
MGERDQVWEHGKNLFPRFKCKYCVKEFCGGRVTRLKSENVARCTKSWYMSTTISKFRIAYMDALHTMMMMIHSID